MLRKPRIDARPAPSRRAFHVDRWRKPIAEPSSLLPDGRLRLLNVERTVIDPLTDGDRLWRYHYHYFDDLVADPDPPRVDRQCDWIARWITAYPPGSVDAWDPYPTSLRIVNWIKWA
ncbi:MAG: hypothetical protein QM811_22870 [Pirellulales bacterium]